MNEPLLKRKSVVDRVVHNQVVVTLFTTLLLVFIVVGSSYAIFNSTDESDKIDVLVSSGNLEITISSDSEQIIMDYNSLGVSNVVGRSNNSYDFTITNTGNQVIKYYEVKVVDKEYSLSNMPYKALNFTIQENGQDESGVLNLGDTSNYIYVGRNLETNESVDLSLKLWLSELYGEIARNRVLNASIEVTLYQEEPINYVFYDVNGGNGLISKTSIKENITDIIPTKEGKVFVGWGLNKENNENLYLSGDSYNGTKGSTLYAIYEDVE